MMKLCIGRSASTYKENTERVICDRAHSVLDSQRGLRPPAD